MAVRFVFVSIIVIGVVLIIIICRVAALLVCLSI